MFSQGAGWLLPIYVGTPKQKLLVLPDSGADALAVGSTLYKKLAQKSGHPPLYDPSKSSTRVLQRGYSFQQGYGGGFEWSGVVYKDTFQIGNIIIKNQAILTVNSSSPSPDLLGQSGAIGFNADPNAPTSPTQLPTWWQNIKSALKQPLFAVDYHNFEFTYSSVYDIGFINTTRYIGSLDYASIETGYTQWYVPIAGIYSKKYGKSNYTTLVTVDTGTRGSSFNYGWLIIWFAFNFPAATFNSSYNTWTYPCSAARPQNFTFLYGSNKVYEAFREDRRSTNSARR